MYASTYTAFPSPVLLGQKFARKTASGRDSLPTFLIEDPGVAGIHRQC